MHDKEFAVRKTKNGCSSGLGLMSNLHIDLFLDSKLAETIPRSQLQNRIQEFVIFPPSKSLDGSSCLFTLLEAHLKRSRYLIVYDAGGSASFQLERIVIL